MSSLIVTDLKQQVVSCVFDGGKDVNGRKIIGSCVLVQSRCYYWAIKDTEKEVLDAGYYKSYCRDLHGEVAATGAILLSVTTDNEQSQVSGIRQYIETECPHLLHFRCGHHTLELIMDDIISSYPGLRSAIREAHTVVTTIRNRKHLSKALESAQAGLQRKPLVLVDF